MSSANVDLARRGFEAMKAGDLGFVAELLDEDIKWHWGDPTAQGACRNRGQALAWMQRPDRRGPGELIDILDAGDRVVVIQRPPPIEDRPSPIQAQITTFRDGRVVEMVGYPTVEAALTAAGVQWEEPGQRD